MHTHTHPWKPSNNPIHICKRMRRRPYLSGKWKSGGHQPDEPVSFPLFLLIFFSCSYPRPSRTTVQTRLNMNKARFFLRTINYKVAVASGGHASTLAALLSLSFPRPSNQNSLGTYLTCRFLTARNQEGEKIIELIKKDCQPLSVIRDGLHQPSYSYIIIQINRNLNCQK